MNDSLYLSEFGECCIKLWEEGTLTPKLVAYDDGTGTWTIAFGCIEGVYKGMKITTDQAEAMFQKEVAKHVAIVRKYLKRAVEQYELDALVSFTFNEGYRPTIFAAANGKDYKNAVPTVMLKYNKARNGKTGKLDTWPGLVKRRANEIQLWHGVYQDARIPVEPPYQVANNNDLYYAADPKKPLSKKVVAAAAGGAVSLANVAVNNISADPLTTAEQVVSTGQRIRGVGQGGHDLATSALSVASWPYVLAAVLTGGGLYWLLCHYLPKKQEVP